MTAPAVVPEGSTVEWGVKHSQGIKWCTSERDARESMASFLAYEERRQSAYRGRNRLVRRWLGPVEEVENPHAEEARS